MDSFVGIWTQASTNNLENLLKTADLPEAVFQAVLAKATSPELREAISVSGQEVTITESIGGLSNKQVKTATIGQEIEFQSGSERKKKLLLAVVDGCLVETLVGKNTRKVVRKVDDVNSQWRGSYQDIYQDIKQPYPSSILHFDFTL